MKKLLVGSVMLASFFTVGAMAEELTGFIGDSQCKHDGSKEKDAACSKACIEKKGADPVFRQPRQSDEPSILIRRTRQRRLLAKKSLSMAA